MSKRVFIVAAKRTPIGSFGGALSSISAPDLAAHAVRAVMAETAVSTDSIDEIIIGAVLQADLGQAPARQVARLAGLSDHTSATTLNKVCASGMKAIAVAAQSILLGDADIVIAGGMESMSRVPFYANTVRWGARFGAQNLSDGLQRDGLSDAYSNEAMGVFAELCAEKYAISREDQDNYAISSYKRSLDAWQKNKFLKEVQPIAIQTRKGEMTVSRDEEFSQVNFDKIPELKPAFKKDGTVTAANASTISDGAAAVLLMSAEKVSELGLIPLAEIVAYADAEQAPEWFTTTPSVAAEKVLKKAGLTVSDIDYFEFNEAFSVVALANAQILGLSLDKVNIYGGAVSLGHPLGCSGARIIVTLSSILRQEGGAIGLAAICNGGGGASAMIIKKI
ncbi:MULTISPECIES: thiolase family protein [unclassified Sphingobacterium]|uniref:thiolase family protein n=1 Tax=unclassified Sphingobacterium TaxID=2609468 RepID=UPI0026009E6A|nr:thiolase family protein [Sphingobacterium sp. UBA5670]